jgi:hypothetical protein
MRNPDYPDDQPKNPVDEALIDRNSDPDAIAGSAPPKRRDDALRDGSSSGQSESSAPSEDDGRS